VGYRVKRGRSPQPADNLVISTEIKRASASRRRKVICFSNRSLILIEAYGLKARATLFATATDVVGVSLHSVDGAIAISDSEIRAFVRNMASLESIVNKPESPISGFELILWIVTSSIHVSDTLGDFREAYEIKLAKKGAEEAILWARPKSPEKSRIAWAGSRTDLDLFILALIDSGISTPYEFQKSAGLSRRLSFVSTSRGVTTPASPA
jgi:hypothetical protein